MFMLENHDRPLAIFDHRHSRTDFLVNGHAAIRAPTENQGM